MLLINVCLRLIYHKQVQRTWRCVAHDAGATDQNEEDSLKGTAEERQRIRENIDEGVT